MWQKYQIYQEPSFVFDFHGYRDPSNMFDLKGFKFEAKREKKVLLYKY